jgi:hypothetical protein
MYCYNCGGRSLPKPFPLSLAVPRTDGRPCGRSVLKAVHVSHPFQQLEGSTVGIHLPQVSPFLRPFQSPSFMSVFRYIRFILHERAPS